MLQPSSLQLQHSNKYSLRSLGKSDDNLDEIVSCKGAYNSSLHVSLSPRLST